MIIILVISIAVLGLVAAYVYLLVHRVDVGLLSLLVAEVVYIAVGPNGSLLGAVHLSPLDAVSLCLFVAGVIRTCTTMKKSIRTARVLAFGYAAIFAISVARGLSENGVFVAGNESRGFVGSLVAVLYFLTAPVDPKSVRRYTLSYLGFGAALCLITMLAAAGLQVGVGAREQTDIAAGDGRYLPSDGAAAIAVCGFLSLAILCYRRGGIQSHVLPVVFMTFAVYLRHRTVWGDAVGRRRVDAADRRPAVSARPSSRIDCRCSCGRSGLVWRQS